MTRGKKIAAVLEKEAASAERQLKQLRRSRTLIGWSAIVSILCVIAWVPTRLAFVGAFFAVAGSLAIAAWIHLWGVFDVLSLQPNALRASLVRTSIRRGDFISLCLDADRLVMFSPHVLAEVLSVDGEYGEAKIVASPEYVDRVLVRPAGSVSLANGAIVRFYRDADAGSMAPTIVVPQQPRPVPRGGFDARDV